MASESGSDIEMQSALPKKSKKKMPKSPFATKMASESGSDIEMQSALPKKSKKKMPKSPSEDLLKKEQEQKKLTTKDMIRDALAVLNTRKGVSLYAVKKFITEKYEVNTDKMNYLLKKSIKSEVEKGSIIQIKGIGASGSFKLAPKKKMEKPIKKKTGKKTKKEKPVKAEGEKETKTSKPKSKTEKTDNIKKKVEVKSTKTTKTGDKKEKPVKAPKVVKEKSEKSKAKVKQTPAKKRAAMMKRKSVGSIIKPPKMKPKAH